MQTNSSYRLAILKERFGVCRLQPDQPVPLDLLKATFISITRTPDELSIVCPEALLPPDVPSEVGWRCMGIQGVLDFSMVGVLAELSSLLAVTGISIFVVSTFNTDYILIKEEKIHEAVAVLEEAGHEIRFL